MKTATKKESKGPTPIIAVAPAAKAEYPAYPVIVGGETYRLCLEFDAMADAETAIRREGHNINLITAFGSGFTLAGTRTLFAAGLRHFHPEVSYARACEMLTFPYAVVAAATIARVLTKDLPDAQPGATASAGV